MKSFILQNISAVTMRADSAAPYGLMHDAALVVKDGMIEWIGDSSDLPAIYHDYPQHDLQGRLVSPALIDCHTHIVHGGNRAVEFEMRLNGASYEDIARAGGGIVSTVRDTRAASEDDLLQQALPRLDAFLAEGTGTIEIKSGYGLSIEDELKMLRVARKLGLLRPIRVITTYLGAHALPEEYKGRADDYIDQICLPALEQGYQEGLIDAVDAFCENIAFTADQVARVFDKARDLGLPVKIHAEQLSNQNGAAMAAGRYSALSADHLEYLDDQGITAMKRGGTVAVILPGAFYTLRESQKPPIEGLRQAGVPMALASDCNPGSSPMTSLLLAMNMATTLFRLTPEEALAGVTRNGAKALGIDDQVGTLDIGKRAELAVWNCDHPAELSYRIGFNPLHQRIIGEWV
ncbi:MAG: imidazolonepropionase [Micavibrio sp.]|nr:imidazolonepropionase [Micavibrio sp.]